MAISDIIDIAERDQIIKHGEESVENLANLYQEGLLTDDQRYSQVLKV
jgi:DNA-directed RNA polymerase beta' subunit